MFKASSKSGRSVIASLVMVAVAATVLSFVPTRGAANTLAESCANPPSTPTLNYWPVTYSDENTPLCHDFPAIDAALDTENPQFSKNEADWLNGLQMNAGQQGVALMYIHNGAANNLDPAQTTAKDVKITTRTETRVGSTHRIDVTFKGSNTNTVNQSFTVHTPANSKLEVIPNSGFMYNYEGRVILDQQNLNLGNSTYTLGDLDACFEYSLFFSFKFKVVTETPSEDTTLQVQKHVKNITDNTEYSDSVNADKGDKVGYRVKVRNNGSTVARNVTLTDNGVNGISIDAGSTSTSGGSLHAGVIPGTLQLGDLQPGQEVTITYTGRVTEDDCDTLVNKATASASNAASVSDTANVKVRCEEQPTNKEIKIRKDVRNLDSGSSSYSQTVDARPGEDVRFRVTVTNNSDVTVNNVRMTDEIPSGFRFADNVNVDGNYENITFSGRTLTVELGSLRRGESRTIEFTAEVVENNARTICNVAQATGTGVNRVQDDACVKVIVTSKPGTPNIVLSKRAHNDTKNVDATTVNAGRGDYVTYTLITTNNGTATQNNYVIRDDLSQVLPLADMVSTNGGTVNGNTISYPAVDIKPGETVVKTFKVRVKQTLDKNLSYQLKNTYGNTIVINVPGDKVFVPPTTGAAGGAAAGFASLVTAGFVALRNRRSLYKLIFA